ncbi:MAG: sugar phosphate isomerase/epimerase [Gemmatimonadetes bacterium]|nr:sugar phosphate isomerase/epimerase [Gemmatimonadota bacterium]
MQACAQDRADERDDFAVPALDPPLDRVDVQLYTLRSLMEEDVAATLEAVARIGYQEVEFAGTFGHTAAQLREWLDASGLSAPGAHIDPAQLDPGRIEATLEDASVLGHRWLIQAFTPEDQRTAGGYRRVAENLNRAGEVGASMGIRTGYHNHAFEFEPLEGTTGFDILASELDPEFADIEIDLHWCHVGGGDALALFAEYPGRFRLCHVKDANESGVMVDVGEGVIDWPSIFGQSEVAGLQHWFVEHDSPGDPLASAEASFRYLKGPGPAERSRG